MDKSHGVPGHHVDWHSAHRTGRYLWRSQQARRGRIRCSTNRMTDLVKAFLTLHHASA